MWTPAILDGTSSADVDIFKIIFLNFLLLFFFPFFPQLWVGPLTLAGLKRVLGKGIAALPSQ